MGLKLQDYLQRQKQFISNVSHELRTPLTAIKGYSEYLSDEIKGNSDLERAVYHLNNESARLTKLVDELLLLSRIDSSREVFDLKRIDMSEVVLQTVKKMELKEQRSGVRINTEIEADIAVCADMEKLIQVIVNILDNAIKFSSKGSIVEVKLTQQEELAILEVADNGIGIPDEEIPKIFDRFYRADNAKSVGGSGLGLAISKEIVEFLNGTITVTSSIGDGTAILIKLPVWKEVLS
jgi:signal transduction histidine kinase